MALRRPASAIAVALSVPALNAVEPSEPITVPAVPKSMVVPELIALAVPPCKV